MISHTLDTRLGVNGMCKHISIFIPNRPGEFFRVVSVLGNQPQPINIVGFQLTTEGELGILKLLCSPHNLAFAVLQGHYRFYCAEKEVLVIQLVNKPNQLAPILGILNTHGINLLNSYTVISEASEPLVVLEFDSAEATKYAAERMREAGFAILRSV